MQSKNTPYILFLLLLLFSCGKSDETYTIEIKDGVNYVHNHTPLWGDEPQVKLIFLQKIGELEAKDENYMFYNHTDIARDTEGNIYVLDSGNYRIQKFDANGKYLLTIGKKGQGPGEILRSRIMCISSDNIIYVPDSENRRVQKFSLNGKAEGSFRMTARGFSSIRSLKSGKIVHTLLEIPIKSESDKSGSLLALSNMKGEIIKKFGEILDLGDPIVNTTANIIYYDVDSKDNIYITFKNENRIEKYTSDGELILRADRPLNYKVENSWKMHKYEMGGRTVELPLQSLTDVALGLGIDHKDRIWINTYKKQRERDDKFSDYLELEIFNNNGVLLGKVPLPRDGLIKVIGDLLYILDNKTEMCVYEYKIVEK